MAQCTVKVYLANLAVWGIKLHNLHWNVTGSLFKPLHEYTEALYDQAFEAYDEVAEVMKMRGGFPPASMKEYLELATMKEEASRAFTSEEVIDQIQADIKLMNAMAKEIRDFAAERDDFQVQSLFEGYLEGFAKQLWFLRAMKGESCCCKTEEQHCGCPSGH